MKIHLKEEEKEEKQQTGYHFAELRTKKLFNSKQKLINKIFLQYTINNNNNNNGYQL